MGIPIGSVGPTQFVNAVIGGREYSGTVSDGFIGVGNVCYCAATGKVVNLSQDNNLPQDKRGWYRVRADKARGLDNSGISYTYSGTYDLSNREHAQYARIDIDNTNDPAYSGGGRVDFTVYWVAIGPLDPSCVPPNPGQPGTDYPWFDSDEWYSVTVSADPANGGSVYGGGVFTKNASCSVFAAPSTGWVFTGWTSSSGRSASTAAHTFTVTGDETWTAHFMRIPYTVSVAASPANGGTVSGGGTFNYGDHCTIIATPNPGKSFVRWESSDGTTRYGANTTFQVKGNVTWTAYFSDGVSIRIRIVRGPSLGRIDGRPSGCYYDRNATQPAPLTVIEDTDSSYIAEAPAGAFLTRLGAVFQIILNRPDVQCYLVKIIEGATPGDITGGPEWAVDPTDHRYFIYAVMDNAFSIYSSMLVVPSNGVDVEIYLRYKSTGELLYGSSGTLLHGSSGNPLYL